MRLDWFAVTVHPKHEYLAERALKYQGLETYLPVRRVQRQWSDRRKQLDAVLFPGYLFCRFESRDKLRVMQSPGVRGIVSAGRDPLPVEESELASIRALIASGRPLGVYPYVCAGQRVRISGGPLDSVRGVIQRVKKHAHDVWRVVVSVETLGYSVCVEVDADQIVPDKILPEPEIPHERRLHGRCQA
jgi:transcription antitermination factor NusG